MGTHGRDWHWMCEITAPLRSQGRAALEGWSRWPLGGSLRRGPGAPRLASKAGKVRRPESVRSPPFPSQMQRKRSEEERERPDGVWPGPGNWGWPRHLALCCQAQPGWPLALRAPQASFKETIQLWLCFVVFLLKRVFEVWKLSSRGTHKLLKVMWQYKPPAPREYLPKCPEEWWI